MTIVKTDSQAYQRTKPVLLNLMQASGIPRGMWEELMLSARLCRYKDGERVFYQGAPAEYWYLVVEGRVDTLREGIDGECRVVQLVKPGQLLAPVVMFMPGPCYPVSSRAVGMTVLCRFRREQLYDLCSSSPEFAVRILEIAGVALCKRINDVESLCSRNGLQRLATYLHELYLEQGEELTLPLSHRELAARLGIRPETLSRLFRKLRSQGAVQGLKQRWVVKDPGMLQSLQHPESP